MNQILILAIRLVLVILGTICGTYIIPILKTKMTADKLELLKTWAICFVEGAENVIIGEKKGNEKREIVEEQIANKANEMGLTVSKEDVRSILEDAYNAMVQAGNKK